MFHENTSQVYVSDWTFSIIEAFRWCLMDVSLVCSAISLGIAPFQTYRSWWHEHCRDLHRELPQCNEAKHVEIASFHTVSNLKPRHLHHPCDRLNDWDKGVSTNNEATTVVPQIQTFCTVAHLSRELSVRNLTVEKLHLFIHFFVFTHFSKFSL